MQFSSHRISDRIVFRIGSEHGERVGGDIEYECEYAAHPGEEGVDVDEDFLMVRRDYEERRGEERHRC